MGREGPLDAGARGKAGGIKLCKTYNEVRQAAEQLLGKRLVTIQTGSDGQPVQRVYIEVAEPFDRELYLGYVLDRKAERIRVIASRRGGMEIEEIAKTEPEAILQVIVEPAVGLQAFQARELAFQLGLNIRLVQRAVTTIMNAYRAFRDLDAIMLEINPLVVTKDDRVLALDAKMSFDDNALFRRLSVADMYDPSQQDPREAQAAEHHLNHISLDGEIGCIVNGAGLAMATMDMIKHAGASPANFLDIGGGASPERTATPPQARPVGPQQRQGGAGSSWHDRGRLVAQGGGACQPVTGRRRCSWCDLPAPMRRQQEDPGRERGSADHCRNLGRGGRESRGGLRSCAPLERPAAVA